MIGRHRNAALLLGLLFLICAVLTRLGVFVGIDHLGMPRSSVRYNQAFSVLVKVLNPAGALPCSLVLTALWSRRVGWRKALLVPAGLLGLMVVEVLCKQMLGQPAGSLPSVLPLGVHLSWSFPSGHEARACFLLALLVAPLPRIFHGLAACVAVWLAGEMIMVGMHYTSDVLGGALLGGCIAAFVLSWLRPADPVS